MKLLQERTEHISDTFLKINLAFYQITLSNYQFNTNSNYFYSKFHLPNYLKFLPQGEKNAQ